MVVNSNESPVSPYQDQWDSILINKIRDALKNVYDPEFPLVDMETLGLFYAIHIIDSSVIHLIMTFTTPACPMGDMIMEMVKNELLNVFPEREIEIEITFEPLRTPKMIKDPDLQRMFE